VHLVNVHVSVLDDLCKHRQLNLHSNFIADSTSKAETNLISLALKCDAFSVITQNKGHYAVQGHSRSPIFGTNRMLVCNFHFLLVNNTNLCPVLHRFQVILYLFSAFLPLVNTHFRG